MDKAPQDKWGTWALCSWPLGKVSHYLGRRKWGGSPRFRPKSLREGCDSHLCTCPSLLAPSLAFGPGGLSLPSWQCRGGGTSPSWRECVGVPTLSPVRCGWVGEKLQGRWEPRPEDSVPGVLWCPGQGIMLSTVSWV